MEMIIMIGLQGSGKSEYVKQHLFDYERVNLDTLHTRTKEQKLLNECFENGRDIVIDNTNPTKEARAKYITQAKEHGYKVTGYYMQSVLKDCIERNSLRDGKAKVPAHVIAHLSKIMELPEYQEGFDELYYIANDGNVFERKEWMEK